MIKSSFNFYFLKLAYLSVIKARSLMDYSAHRLIDHKLGKYRYVYKANNTF